MIGAREQTSAAAALGHLGAAMPAHIEECAQPAVATAHDQDGHAGKIIGAEAAGRRPLRGESHHDRVLAEQDPLLGGETLRIGVDRHIVAPGRVGHGGGLGVDEMQQPLQKVNLVMPAHRTNSGFLSRLKWEIEITRYATVSCAAVLFNTAPYRSIAPETTGRDREACQASLGGSVSAPRDRLRCKSLLFGFQQEPGAGRDEAGSTARRLVEEKEALAEQERIEKHGAGFRVGRRKTEFAKE